MLLLLDGVGVETVVVLGNLVCILAWSWHLDGAGPVGVHVAESVSHILKRLLGEILRLIQADVEVGWRHTSLSCLLRNQEEIEALVVLLVLNEVGIDDAARLWVLHASAVWSLDKHPLVDSLVDYDQSDWWDSCDGVVDRLQHLLELRDLLLNDLISHSLTNTISVDDDLRWKIALILIRKALDGVDHASIEILFHNLLILCLDDDV